MGSAVPSLENSETILIVAPTGQDGHLAATLLAKSNIEALVLRSVAELCDHLDKPHGGVIIAEEAITRENSELLKQKIASQEAWSDVPLILLTSPRRSNESENIPQQLSVSGNISILERPFRLVTLLRAVKVAIRARRRQYQVRELLKHQERALQQRDEFLSIASHELKTPITTLKLQSQLTKTLLSKGDKSVYQPERIDKLIGSIERQTERLARLVDDMLDISRLDNKKLRITPEDCNLSEIVTQVLDTFAQQFQAVGCVVSSRLDPQICGSWDRYRIEQVIANLFTNSIKYGARNPVRVEVSREPLFAVLKVTDKGLGISKEDQERIFHRFERAVSKDNISGLGLGLFIAKEIIEMHKGFISVDSEIDKGSTFTVRLPIGVRDERLCEPNVNLDLSTHIAQE